MKIKVDKEGKDTIIQLCDVALKSGGIKNVAAINVVLTSIEDIEEKTEPTDK